MGTVSADDAIDDNSTEENIQNASFSKVSKTNYIDNDSFEVSLLDDNGTGIANQSVYFTVGNDTREAITDENGTVIFLLNLSKGKYTINYLFNGSGYAPIKESKNILLLTESTSTIKGSNVKIYAGIKTTYKVTLKVDGMLLSGFNVKFTINKKTYYAKTNSKGQASITLYLSKGKYTVKYSYAGEENINSSASKSTVNVVYHKNPYKTKYRHVYIDADGGFNKSFLKTIAKKLRKAGWKVTVYGIGPGQHSINYKKVKGGVYMPFYNGLCAGTIKEMAKKYYSGVLKSHKSVLAPAWYTKKWDSKKMKKYRNDITKIKFLKRAWDDNFSPRSFKGIKTPAKYMSDNKIRYCVGDTTDTIVNQFIHGGWVVHHDLTT